MASELVLESPASTTSSPGILTPSRSFSSCHSSVSLGSTLQIRRTPSVKFAPLPSKDPTPSNGRKKRPMGVAGRNSILRNQNRGSGFYGPDDHDPSQVGFPRSSARAQLHRRQMEEDDDALLELGRIMKDAGKKLWRNVSHGKRHHIASPDPQPEPTADETASHSDTVAEPPKASNDSDPADLWQDDRTVVEMPHRISMHVETVHDEPVNLTPLDTITEKPSPQGFPTSHSPTHLIQKQKSIS